MKYILVDIDTQFDFAHPNGALYVQDPTHAASEAIATEISNAIIDGAPIIGSVDSHAYDSWEFEDNGGPFPAHCVKGTHGWLGEFTHLQEKTRYIPMQEANPVRNVIGEAQQGRGNRVQQAADIAEEALNGVGIYFEKEVYSMLSNPAAGPVVDSLVAQMGGADNVVFRVIGYCTGGYCVDAAVKGLLARGYKVEVLSDATVAIGGSEGKEMSRQELTEAGAVWRSTSSVHRGAPLWTVLKEALEVAAGEGLLGTADEAARSWEHVRGLAAREGVTLETPFWATAEDDEE